MADKKKYAPRLTTPIGVLRYPHINKPDAKFNPDKPRYKAPLILDAADAQNIIDLVTADQEFGLPAAEALRETAVTNARKAGKKLKPKDDPNNAELKLPYSEMVDPDTGADTGQFVVNIGGNDRYKKADGSTVMLTVKFFSAAGQPIAERDKPEVWGGSRVRVCYTHFPYYNSATNEYGVSLRLEAVKLIEVRSGGGAGDAAGFGFGDAEEGYEVAPKGDMEGDESPLAGEKGAFGPVPSDADF